MVSDESDHLVLNRFPITRHICSVKEVLLCPHCLLLKSPLGQGLHTFVLLGEIRGYPHFLEDLFLKSNNPLKASDLMDL